MASWNTMLLREPTMDECHEVARRYVDGVAMSMDDHLTAHAAEAAAWVLSRPRGAGDLD